MFLNAIFLILDANLLGFHLYLKQKGLSTYDYIINKRIEVSNKKGRPKSPMRQKQNNTVVDICCGNKKTHKRNKISQIHAIPSEADSQRSQYQQYQLRITQKQKDNLIVIK
ncbi:hypothetical protein PPERSA_06112 [Pseudocohnilembus persalinus]|uniref:Uncharacterized protein n=1 Tax=Pseudocohnilembus persalinus TaxID=266149 RepID=A0A0V0QVK1_PSEPJ|nr:hypothetical protein PPERSA_06112 [Pseudocohnilembus persalinus]|eukprot:KRX06230.1 hypothetical protein PPERSA_06112 [Pseudocohnilembus persalinus]